MSGNDHGLISSAVRPSGSCFSRWRPRRCRPTCPPLKPSYKRWKKRLDQIMSWDCFNPADSMTDAKIDERVKTSRHKAMYKDESKID